MTQAIVSKYIASNNIGSPLRTERHSLGRNTAVPYVAPKFSLVTKRACTVTSFKLKLWRHICARMHVEGGPKVAECSGSETEWSSRRMLGGAPAHTYTE